MIITLLDIDVVALGEPLLQRQVAERRPVVERGRAVAGERRLRAVAELVDGRIRPGQPRAKEMRLMARVYCEFPTR